MKILKNKTYKNLLLKIEVLESDKERLIKKCDFQQMDFNGLSGRFELQRDEIKNLIDKNIKIQANLDDQTDYISSLNERLQKAEAERDLLRTKLSRKGLGKKGRKKENVVEQPIDESQITEVEFEKQNYIEITSLEQLKEYFEHKFECVLSYDNKSDNISGDIVSVDDDVHFLFNSDNVGWSKDDRFESKYNKVWYVDNYELKHHIKSLRILL